MQRGLTRTRRVACALARTERGAVTLEAALITPLICLIVFGAVEFGFYFKEAHTVSSAATRGGREVSALPKMNGYEVRGANLISNALVCPQRRRPRDREGRDLQGRHLCRARW